VRHLDEEELLLHQFGEDEDPSVQGHLDECAACRAALDGLRRDLEAVPVPEPPARGESYGGEVWARLEPRLRPRPRLAWATNVRRAWAPLAMAASLVLAFLLGRHWPPPAPPPAPVSAAVRERILLVAVGDHLERSEMLLVELAHAGEGGQGADISSQQQWAKDLLGDNRLYRQTVLRAGDPGVASVLDELERLLVEVAHRPSSMTASEVEDIRHRIESRGLLFRVRVIETQVREKEKENVGAPARAGAVS
jgi:hypothetical protein